MILLFYAFLVLAARGLVKDYFRNGSRVEFFIREGGCLDVSTRAVGCTAFSPHHTFSSP
jgi:hypothetical protein